MQMNATTHVSVTRCNFSVKIFYFTVCRAERIGGLYLLTKILNIKSDWREKMFGNYFVIILLSVNIEFKKNHVYCNNIIIVL